MTREKKGALSRGVFREVRVLYDFCNLLCSVAVLVSYSEVEHYIFHEVLELPLYNSYPMPSTLKSRHQNCCSQKEFPSPKKKSTTEEPIKLEREWEDASARGIEPGLEPRPRQVSAPWRVSSPISSFSISSILEEHEYTPARFPIEN